MMFATSRASESSRAKPNGRVRSRSRTGPLRGAGQPLARARVRNEAVTSVLGKRGEPEVLAHGLGLEDALGAALARHVGSAHAGVFASLPQLLEELVLAVPFQAGETDHLP